MDSLRGSFAETNDRMNGDGGDSALADDAAPAIGRNERRMQVRAYNFWASLLEDRNFPAIDDLLTASQPDFAPFGVLLDFSNGVENPGIARLGAELAQECGADAPTIRTLADVPGRSLLSRITDHYMQILANQTPIGFEAEFVNQRGLNVMYRGILLPFSSDDATIDFIYGVINWKVGAAPAAKGELLLGMDQALAPDPASVPASVLAPPQPATLSTGALPLGSWADGPASLAIPQPSFGMDEGFGPGDPGHDFRPADGDPADMGLADLLAAARELALAAHSNEDRTRSSLYAAIGRAYDFLLAARDSPEELAEMVADAGLTMQQRAPMTPVVKLVFGADYDKTRLTEYAAALTHAARLGLPHGALAEFLRHHDGGLKGVVKAERALRREEGGSQTLSREGPGRQLVRQLRTLPVRGFDAIAPDGSEFALVLIRRGEDRQISMLGEVPDDTALVQRAARHLLG